VSEKSFQNEGWRGAIRWRRTVDVRYRGQGYELNVPYTGRLVGAFRREHQRRYGYTYEGREVELVTLRLRATMKSARSSLTMGRVGAGDPPAQSREIRPQLATAPVFFSGKPLRAAVYARDELRIGKEYSGPAVMTEYSATTVVPPQMSFRLDRTGNLLIART
jgi:N-methylhydantoinase A